MDREQQIEWARRYLVKNWQQPNEQTNTSWGMRTWTEKDRGGNDRTTPDFWHKLPYRILAASPHLQGILGHGEILDKLLESMPLLEALEILERELG